MTSMTTIFILIASIITIITTYGNATFYPDSRVSTVPPFMAINPSDIHPSIYRHRRQAVATSSSPGSLMSSTQSTDSDKPIITKIKFKDWPSEGLSILQRGIDLILGAASVKRHKRSVKNGMASKSSVARKSAIAMPRWFLNEYNL